MSDEEWHKFGGALRWWAQSEYKMMIEAQTTEEEAVAELGLHAALDSLARYFVVAENEKGIEIDMSKAFQVAHSVIREDYASNLDEQLDL
jgi:hypothetical protein